MIWEDVEIWLVFKDLVCFFEYSASHISVDERRLIRAMLTSHPTESHDAAVERELIAQLALAAFPIERDQLSRARLHLKKLLRSELWMFGLTERSKAISRATVAISAAIVPAFDGREAVAGSWRFYHRDRAGNRIVAVEVACPFPRSFDDLRMPLGIMLVRADLVNTIDLRAQLGLGWS